MIAAWRGLTCEAEMLLKFTLKLSYNRRSGKKPNTPGTPG
jgi:hypothetical protein